MVYVHYESLRMYFLSEMNLKVKNMTGNFIHSRQAQDKPPDQLCTQALWVEGFMYTTIYQNVTAAQKHTEYVSVTRLIMLNILHSQC